MKRIPAVAIIVTMIFSACSSSSEKKSDVTKDKYEQTKETLEETEKKNPPMFLTVGGHDKHNLIGQTVIKGTISNSAKVATYTDVHLKFTYYSKTKAQLGEDEETIFETIAPGKSADFKTKYYAPKGTDSVGFKVMTAKSE